MFYIRKGVKQFPAAFSLGGVLASTAPSGPAIARSLGDDGTENTKTCVLPPPSYPQNTVKPHLTSLISLKLNSISFKRLPFRYMLQR